MEVAGITGGEMGDGTRFVEQRSSAPTPSAALHSLWSGGVWSYADKRLPPRPTRFKVAYRVLCLPWAREGSTMSFAIYFVGLLLLVGGIAWGLTVAGVSAAYVGIACLIVLGIGIMMAVSRTRTKDVSS
jgi:hypothetical protein